MEAINRYKYMKPKIVFNTSLVLSFIKENPGLSSSQITHKMNREYCLGKEINEVFAIVSVLKRKGKIKVGKGKGISGGLTYESI